MIEIPVILASASPARLELLKRINIVPDQVIHSNLDESQKRGELPHILAQRLSFEKANFVANNFDKAIVIGADSVVVTGRTILPKALNPEDIKYCMGKLSGRRHRVYTAISIIKKVYTEIQIRQKYVETKVKFKRFTIEEIDFYSTLEEGLNKAGGYSISGYAESFISFISGSHSNVVGLPLFETRNMLFSLGKDCNILKIN